MSADNYIAIQNRKGIWYVWMDWASNPRNRPTGADMKKFDTEHEAITYAAKLCEDCIVEYGIRLLPEMRQK